jgi:hypothetical protein
MRRARRPIFFGCRSSSWRHPLKSCPRPPHSVGQVSLRPHCQARGEEYTLMVNASLCALSCLGVLAPAVHPAAVTHARSDPGSLRRRTRRSATALPYVRTAARRLIRFLARPARSPHLRAPCKKRGRVTDRHRRPVPGRETSAPGVILSPPVPLCGAGDAAYLDVHVRGCNRGVAARLQQRAGRRREAL